MKLSNGRLALVAAMMASVLAILTVAIPANAQSGSLLIKIPFEFQVGNMKLPAGDYVVNRTGDAIQISDRNGHSAFALSSATPNPAASLDNQIVFNRYGDNYFLSVVRWNGYTNARELPKTSRELELAELKVVPTVLTASATR